MLFLPQRKTALRNEAEGSFSSRQFISPRSAGGNYKQVAYLLVAWRQAAVRWRRRGTKFFVMASGHPPARPLYHILCESKQKSPSVFNFVDYAADYLLEH